MALLVDGLVSNLDEVMQVDSGLGDVARAESINIDHKLRLAQRDCELKIAQFVINHGLEAKLGVSNNLPRLDRVVVCNGLKQWFCLHALQLFYSDAYYRVLNDRYGKKLEHFAKLATGAWESYVDTGIKCVFSPIRQGQILRVEMNETPIGAGSYDVALRWVDTAGQCGGLSEAMTVTVGPGEGFSIVPGVPPAGVVGYDVFAALAGSPLCQQNSGAVDIGNLYSTSVIVTSEGQTSALAQPIDFVIRKNRMFTRG